MIQLSENLLIASGHDRRCYRHPGHEDRLLKVCIDTRDGALKRTRREVAAYRVLYRRKADTSLIATYFGEVETSAGPGFAFEFVRDEDGEISPTVEKFLEGPPADFDRERDLPRLFHELYDQCHACACILSDLHSKNIVVRHSKDAGRREFCMIDGLGNADFIKICNWSPLFARFKLKRKFRKWASRLGIEFAR